jgi:pimeloyl-ACP methyl ester carboxylesterase
MHRCLILSLMPLLIVGISPGNAQRKPDPVIAKYADTSRAASLSDGRHINMVCMGRGKPTVILNAGAADWGVVWGRVQGKIAQQTQVCTWDRAGFGFSTASSAQQSVDETTHDLERALRANKMPGPFVLVGHSIGAYEALIFADRNKSAVTGIVLVDPSIPDQSARLARVAPETTRTNDSSLASFISQRRACADMLDRRPTDAPACTQYGGEIPSSVSSALARLDRSPARMRTTASLLDNITNDTRLAVNHGRQYGSTPLIILSASNSFVAPEGASAATRMEVNRKQEELAKGHVELAALSRRGEHRLVGDAGHYLQLEHPDIVAAAVIEVVTQARKQTNR